MNRSTNPRPTSAGHDDSARSVVADTPLAVALLAADDLAEVLGRLGIALPSLRPDLASCTTTTAPRPLIELGRVNLHTAALLTAALRTAAAATTAPEAGDLP
ncbi:hypothetical protein [Streptomyces pacificus]|uniref:hypothetical protein n=1 Tax=Streptomyces pacificus TaxID=2705029 RepID=UPI001567BB51|nr:hypothetical protein [Streptomyces pacificus]